MCVCIYIHVYMYVSICIHITIGKESMNLKENEEGYIVSLGGRKWKLFRIKIQTKTNKIFLTEQQNHKMLSEYSHL